jgi:hypothetical protein
MPRRKKPAQPAAEAAHVHPLSASDLATQAASLGEPAFREFKLRLPAPVAERIAAKAKLRGTPQSRQIIEELLAVPNLENRRDLSELIEDMRDTLAHYGARARLADASDDLLAAVDAVLKAEGPGALQAAVDRLRIIRSGMKKIEQMTIK